MLTDTLGVITTAGVSATLPWPLVWLLVSIFVPGALVAGRWLRELVLQAWRWIETYDATRDAELRDHPLARQDARP